jgi:hypothetical protein
MPPSRLTSGLWALFGALAERRFLVIALSGIMTFAGCLAVDVARGHDPLPEIHDEYAYLLASDTFAHGRLTNPPHPLWRSFETFHELQRPTRQTKHPPGQGLFLALGQVLAGRPIVGAWISCALFVSALCWMLQAWLPPRWAVIGTALGAVTVLSGRVADGGTLAYWSQSYWGGAPTALGSSLLFGAVKHGLDRPRWTAGLAMGIGLSLLAMTRPYEGLLATAGAGAIMALGLARANRPILGLAIRRVCLPAACIVAVSFAWQGYYNDRVTGDPLRFPYVEYARQYESAPLWRWQPVREEPPGLNRQMHDYARWEVTSAEMVVGRPLFRAVTMYQTLVFEAGPVLAPLTLLLLPWTLRSRPMRLIGGAALLITVGTLAVSYYQTHYHAPAAPLMILLAAGTLRRISLLRVGPRRGGLALAVLLLVATIANAGRMWWAESHAPERLMTHWAAARAEVEEDLPADTDGHVVFVRYGPKHSPHLEVVFNAADVDSQRVVWARDLGPVQNAVVLRYYSKRTPWLLTFEDDMAPSTLKRYATAAPVGAAAPRMLGPR